MKKILRVLFLFMVLCVCFAHVAVADTATAGTNTMTVFDDLAHIAAYTLSILLMGLLTLAANKLRQKWHLDVPQAWLDKVHSYIDLGIAYAEEQGRKAVTGTSVATNDKLDTAFGFVLKFLGDDKQLVALGEEKIKQLIEARLNQTRVDTQPFLSSSATDAPVVHSVVTSPTGGAQTIVMNDGTTKPLTTSQEKPQ